MVSRLYFCLHLLLTFWNLSPHSFLCWDTTRELKKKSNDAQYFIVVYRKNMQWKFFVDEKINKIK